jgi:sugar phosphate permease
VGPAWGLLANVLIYTPLTLLLFRLPRIDQGAQSTHDWCARLSGLRGARRVIDAVRADRWIATMIMLGGAASLFVGNAFQAQMPAYAHGFGADEAGAWYTILLAANAAGAILGAVLLESTNLLRPGVRTAIVCAGAWGLTIGCFSASPNYAAAVALLVLAGAFDITFASMAQTQVQVLAPAHLRGSVVGVFNTAVLGLRAGSGVTVGVLGAVTSVHWSLALGASAVVVTCVALLGRERIGVSAPPRGI